MKLDEIKGIITPAMVRQLDKDTLDSIPYSVLKWGCCVMGCSGYTTVRDYGISPHYLLNRNSKGISRNTVKYWENCNKRVWLCSKHFRQFKEQGQIKFFRSNPHMLTTPEILVKQVNQNIEKLG